MCYMFEVYYSPPMDQQREAALTAKVMQFGGRLDYREAANGEAPGAICLTYEFDERAGAESAAAALRERGEHVEGPIQYGANADR